MEISRLEEQEPKVKDESSRDLCIMNGVIRFQTESDIEGV